MEAGKLHSEGYTYKYPHPAVTADCVVFGFDGRDLRVLLIERGMEPFKGFWAFPGGFMAMDETAEECALRELREETGMELDKVRELGSFSGVNRDPRERVVSIAFYSLARQSEVRGGDDAAKAHWWPIDEVPQLAFDHDYILRKALKRIQKDIHFEPVGFDLLDDHFTIAELQRLYESILGVHFDRRNFYRKMLQTGVLQEVDRPARTQYFGKHREMKSKDIDELLDFPPTLSPLESTTPLACAETSAPDYAATEARSHTAGRKGKMFRFNKEKYNSLKENGNFRLEF